MFCPNCGRDNSRELKFCVACGTNLEAVSQALSGTSGDFFTRTDMALDHLIARYSEHVFKDAPANALNRSTANSWKLLGQATVTSLADVVLFFIIWNVLPLKFLILLFSTPIRLLLEKSRNQKGGAAALPEARPQNWLSEPVPSVSEHTTEMLQKPDVEINRR
jgi:Double zinc ribbon